MTVERPLRIAGADPDRAYTAAELKKLKVTRERSETAPPVIRKIHKRGTDADPLRGRFAATIDGRSAVVEYEADTDLRDTEQIPLQEAGGIESFLRREVLPYAADAWYRPDSVRTGYEISFTRYFYKPKPLRTLAEVGADILAVQRRAEGLLEGLLVRKPSPHPVKLRIYADTSVIGPCKDEESRDASRRLIESCARGEVMLVVSAVTFGEFVNAPQAVRDVLLSIDPVHLERVELTGEVESLAIRYIEEGVLARTMRADALHVAAATVAGVDVLASWNFRHLVNLRRIREFNEVNRSVGHPPLDIRTPKELGHDE